MVRKSEGHEPVYPIFSSIHAAVFFEYDVYACTHHNMKKERRSILHYYIYSRKAESS